ncbi:expressed unknown protein [Seminavis robusta]|uniref:Uncharacterized protein n=1 Tax=Seminavis robusta TaxID=568900 RepID=A0A9N8E1T9_9STRA|nr:expressed unknown protein [Seminavis robusta]|eukprot:Sro562_g166990.1 n/a (473) ;mRNA; f:17976-19394
MNDIAQIGNWTTEESEYILALMKEFKAGTLPIAKGTTLRKFLSRELGCNVNQITKKFKGTSYDARSKYSGSLSSSKSPIEDRLRLDQLDMLKKRYQDGQKDAPVAPKTTKKAARVIASVQHISQHAKAPPMTTEITVAVMPVEQSPAMAAGQRTLQDIDWLALAGGQALQALNNHQASPLSTGLSGGLKQQQQSAPAASVTYASLTATVAPTRDNWQQQTQQTLSFGNVNSAPSSNEWAQALLGYGQQQQSSSAASLYNNAVEQALLERYGHSDSQPSHAASLYSAQSNNEVAQALLERYGHSDSQPSHAASLYSAQSNNEVTQALLERYGHSDSQPSHGASLYNTQSHNAVAQALLERYGHSDSQPSHAASLYSAQSNNAVAQALQGYGYGNPQSSIASSMYSTPSDSAVAQALLGYGYSAPQPSTASSLYGTQSNNAVAQALLGHSDQNTASAYMSLDPNVFAYLTQAPY